MTIRLIGVSREYSSGARPVPALQDISLEIASGEFVCVVGPSGCGKSTLLDLIAGLQRPDSGEVFVDSGGHGAPVLIFQEAALFPWLTIQANVEFGLRMHGVPKAERQAAALEKLAVVRLQKFAHARPHELSGGMKQRAAIARALALDPPVLLMDEPFAALDAQSRDIMHQELQRIWAETRKTIVFVTHNVREAICLADRVVLMTARPGRVKDVIPVDLPRPRSVSHPAIAALASVALEHLREEIQQVERDEFDTGWRYPETGIRADTPGDMAGRR